MDAYARATRLSCTERSRSISVAFMLKLNLLSSKQKEELEWEKNRRLAVFSAGVLFILLTFFALLLYSGIFYINIQLEPIETEIEVESAREETQAAKDLEKNIQVFIRRLSSLHEIQENGDDYALLLRELALLPPDDVVVGTITVTETTGKESSVGAVRIAGHAETRNQVIEFEDAIKQNAHFGNLDSPFSNKNKERDIDFTFTFDIINEI